MKEQNQVKSTIAMFDVVAIEGWLSPNQNEFVVFGIVPYPEVRIDLVHITGMFTTHMEVPQLKKLRSLTSEEIKVIPSRKLHEVAALLGAL